MLQNLREKAPEYTPVQSATTQLSALARDFRISRRHLLFAAALAAGCGRKRANRYPGLLFVGSTSGNAISVADLSDFRRIGTISAEAAPRSLVRTQSGVWAFCSDPAIAVRIDPSRLIVASKLRLPARPVTARMSGAGDRIAVLATAPDCVIVVDAQGNRILARVPLPGPGAAMDVWQDRVAVSIPSMRSIARIRLSDCRAAGRTDSGTAGTPVVFRLDGKMLLAGDPERREIITTDWSTGALLARLPLPVQPRHVCFTESDNGGQMFVTGPGADVVAIVAPYQNEVYETIPAGRQPAAMTVTTVGKSRNLLLVSNPSSGDVTILDIESRQLAASVHIGDTPREILATPDGEYALVVNGGSGSVAVIRLSTVLNRGQNELTARNIKPLFTVFPMMSDPDSAVIVPYSAG